MTLGLEFPTQRTQKMKPKQGFKSSPRLLDCSLTQTPGPKQVSAQDTQPLPVLPEPPPLPQG